VKELIYKKERYEIIGCAFDVFNKLGYGHKELFYEKALTQEFEERKIPFQEQVEMRGIYKKKDLGIYRLDFLVYNKIVVELKNKYFFSKKDIN
jgi:GxxExxY protein